jgi:hypothetical protein
MEWNVWVIKPYTTYLTVLMKQNKTFSPSVLQKFLPQGSEFSQFRLCCPSSNWCKIFSMESEISHVKRACLLSQNQIREIVMDSDSNEEKYYASDGTEDEQEPRPPTRRSLISQPASPDFLASSSEDEDDIANVAGQQPQPCLWTLPPKT